MLLVKKAAKQVGSDLGNAAKKKPRPWADNKWVAKSGQVSSAS
jgi:hypothetical protein